MIKKNKRSALPWNLATWRLLVALIGIVWMEQCGRKDKKESIENCRSEI
jgi:hypothetical protein